MTAQAPDSIFWNNKSYVLQGYISLSLSAEELFLPSKYGLVPSSHCPTDCYRGFICTYKIDNMELFLRDLTFYSDNLEYPPINNILPELDEWGNQAIYSGLDIPIKFSGEMRLADSLIRYRHMGYQDVTSYEYIFDLSFTDGILVSHEDISSKVNEMRKAQGCIAHYLTKSYVPPQKRKRLHETFAFGRTGISFQFSNTVDSFNPDKALRILDEIEESRKDIRWFIESHLAHYNEMHGYAHTFKHLEYLGVSDQLLSSLRDIQGDSYHEENVVLALIQVLLEVEADGKWGNVLPTVFERKINKANLSQELVDNVRRVVSALYR